MFANFILKFSFSIAIAPLQNSFSVLQIGLNDYFKYCFLMVTAFTSTLFIGFFIYLPNIALFLNLAFWFLILVPSSCFSSQICIVSNMVLNYKPFLIINPNLYEVLGSDFVFFLLPKLGIRFLSLPREDFYPL